MVEFIVLSVGQLAKAEMCKGFFSILFWEDKPGKALLVLYDVG